MTVRPCRISAVLVSFLVLGVVSMASLQAQCNQQILITTEDHGAEVIMNIQAAGSCPLNGHVDYYRSIDGSPMGPGPSCNNPPGQVCTWISPGGWGCAEGQHTVRIDAHCYVPGPNNSCVEAVGSAQANFTIAPQASISASVHGLPFFDSFHTKVIGFSAHAEWQGAANSQLLWIADWLPSKTQGSMHLITNGQINPNGDAPNTRIGLTDGRSVAKVTIFACGGHPDFAFFAVDSNECCPRCDKEVSPGCFGGPITASGGNMRYSDTDPLPFIAGIPMSRTYNSNNTDTGWFGSAWTSFLDEWLRAESEPDGSATATIGTAEDNRRVFHGSGTLDQVWPQESKRGTLRSDGADGYILREYGADVERSFSSAGRIYKLHRLSTGQDVTIDYDGNGRITHVGDSWGTTGWTVTEDAAGRISTIAVDGTPMVWTYVYDGSGRLQSVKQGTAVWRSYVYGGKLTEVRDAANHLLEGHAYGTDGATSSLGRTDDITNVEYYLSSGDPDVWITRVTYATGAQALYSVKHIAGRPRVDHIDGDCGSCGVRDAVYAYDDRGRMTRVQNARGYITSRTYDARDRLVAETSALVPAGCDPETDSARCRRVGTLGATDLSPTAASLTQVFTYGGDPWYDRPISITTTSVLSPTGSRTESMTYDPQTGELLTRTVSGWTGSASSPQQELHTATTALYDGSEGAAFDPGGVFNSSWQALPQPRLRKSSDGPRADVSDVTRWVYYPVDASVPAFSRGRLAAIRDAVGNTTRFDSYDAFGHPTRTVDVNGVAAEYTYDGAERLLTSTAKGVAGCDPPSDALCATDLTTTRSYQPPFGPLASETRPNGATTTYEYDDRDRLKATVRPVSATSFERLEYDYDLLTGRKSAERYLSGQPGAWTVARSEAFRYDSLGRLLAVDHPDGKSLLYTYDPANNLATVQDENHATPNTTYNYDPLNRLIRVGQTLATAAGGSIATQYAYDLHGNLVSVTDPNGNTTTYTFDDFARMTRQVSSVTGTTSYAYDAAGNLTSTIDANAATTTRSYDALNRVTSAVSSKGSATEAVSWTYDDATAGRFAVGRLASMIDPTGSTSYSYQRLGLLRSETKTVAEASYTTGYGYDADGNRSSIAYPSGPLVTYGFDLADRPLSAQSPGTVYVSSASYLPFGPITQLVYGNGTAKTTRYDTRYRPLENKLAGPGGIIADDNYAEDGAGNITQIHDAVDPAFNRDFGYDDLNRLTTANSGPSLWGTGGYTYDAMGNMLTSTVGGAQSFTYVGTTPKLASVTYDAAGNETTTDRCSPRNLRQGFGYDGRGVRSEFFQPAARGSLGKRFDVVYTPEWRLLSSHSEELDDSEIVATWINLRDQQIIWFGDLPVAQRDVGPYQVDLGIDDPPPQEMIRFTFTDHLGTPLLQTDDQAAVVWRAEYTPFGTIRTMRAGDATDQPLRLPGQDILSGEDVYYNIFRWYRAGWGRYTQSDSLGIGGRGIARFPSGERVTWTQRHFENLRSHGFSGASALTTYAYAEDTPVRAADPLGLIIWNCLAKATTAMTTHRPNDPQDIKKGLKLVCVYEVECETVDFLSPFPIKIEGFWIRDMHTIRPCTCDKYCSFQVVGLPQTVMDQNFFLPFGPPYCSNFDGRNGI